MCEITSMPMKQIYTTIYPWPGVILWLLEAADALRQAVGSVRRDPKEDYALEDENTREFESDFLRMLDEHQGIIYKICHSYTNTRQDFEDLYQEIVYQLWKAFPGFRGKSKITTWMHTAAVRTAIMPFRRKVRAYIESTGALPDQVADEPEIGEGPDDRVFQVFNKLGNFEKGVLVLMLEGYANHEIAKIMRMSSSTLKRRMRRVRKSIEND